MRTIKPFVLCLALLLPLAGCGGSGDTDTLSPASSASAPASPSSASARDGETTIRVGMSTSQLNQTLGQPDSITTDAAGREVWSYERKRAEFVYTAGNELIIGGCMTENMGAGPLSLIIVLDKSRKVADFSYSQLPM